jgi:thioredoxin-like negative regulator of GroEL
MSNVETLTQHTITDALRQAGILVIDLWAPSCGPCRFATVNVDEQPTVASAFQIRSIPTLVVISDGEVIGAYPGVVGAEQLAGALDQLVPTPEPETVLHQRTAR